MNRWYWDNAEQMIVSAADNSHLAIEDFIMFTNGVEREREQLRARNARLAEPVTEELAGILESLARVMDETGIASGVSSVTDEIERACALAARIRAALALEMNDA